MKGADAETFSVFSACLVTHNLEHAPEFVEEIKGTTEERKSKIDSQTQLLTKCYILGDFILAEDFRNCVMDTWISMAKVQYQKFCKLASSGDNIISMAFSSLPLSSPYCRAFLYLYVCLIKREDLKGPAFSLEGIPAFWREVGLIGITLYEVTR